MNNTLSKRFEEIKEIAHSLNLDFFNTGFEIVPMEIMSEIAAYGLPIRFQHYSFGMVYNRYKIHGKMGLSRIYEIVLNNNPSYAFLLDTNNEIENLLVAAHVFAHVDFFKHNKLFESSNRNMINEATHHAQRIDKYIESYGLEAVEHLIDIAFALDRHIDFKKGLYRDKYPKRKIIEKEVYTDEYADMFGEKKLSVKREIINDKLPPYPEQDLLWFLANYAPIEEWEKDILEIIREESFYFYPQYMCVTGDTYISTKNGLVEIKDLPYININLDSELIEKEIEILSINDTFQKTSHLYRKKVNKTIKITTQLGFEIEGRPEHPIATFNENLDMEFKKLKDISEGDYIILEQSSKVFAPTNYKFDYKEREYESLIECCICKNKFKQLDRHIIKIHSLSVEEYKQRYNTKKIVSEEIIYSRHQDIKIPLEITKELARIFGYYIGDGSWLSNRTMTFTNKDKSVIDDFIYCLINTFAISSPKIYDIDNGSCLRVEFYNKKIFDFFEYCGLKKGVAFTKEIPFTILQSTEEIIKEFLKALFECDGHNSKHIGYVSTSRKLIQQIHLLLFHLGILSVIDKEIIHENKNHRSGFNLRITGPFKEKFMKEIGFVSERKNKENHKKENNLGIRCYYNRIPFVKCKLRNIKLASTNYSTTGRNSEFNKNELKNNKFLEKLKKKDLSLYFKIIYLLEKNRYYLKVTSKEEINEEKYVYDMSISMDMFLSNGFISHNSKIINEGHASYWHAEILNNYDSLTPSETIEFAKLHSSVVNPGHPGSLNPYYLGYKILIDIEKRWDEKHKNGESTITGREKLFEVRAEEDDISFIRNYLTEELAEELKLFSYGASCEHDHGTKKCDKCGELVIKSKELDAIIEAIIINKVNYGVPMISIVDIKEEQLYLKQEPSGLPGLDQPYAEKTIEYIYNLWKRPVHIQTIDESGKPKELWYVGKK